MPKIEPVYEPRGHDVFDGGEDDFELENDEGSRLPLLIVIGLLVLAAFGGVVWLAYQHGVEKGMKDAPRQIASQDSSAPPQSYTKIYQKAAPSDEDTANDDTAPPSPTMKSEAAPAATKPPPVVVIPAPSTPAATKTKTVVAAKPIAPPPVPKAVLAEPVATKPPTKLMTETQTASTATTQTKPVAATPAPAKPVAKIPAPSTPALSVPPPSTPAPAVAAATTSGAYVLQIGSYRSQEEAASSWNEYKTKHAIAAGYSDSIAKADLGAKGTWYRLRLGGFDSKDAATAFCAELKADGGECIPAKN